MPVAPRRARAPSLVLLAVLFAPFTTAVSAPTPPLPPLPSPACSACLAVAAALSARLEDEAPRNDLDWRGRVGPDGARTGVRVAYAVSEARLWALLGDLCTDGLGDAAWWRPPAVEGDDNDDGADADAGVWGLKQGAPPRPGWAVPAGRPEREARAKALENACGRLVSDWEDELGAALKAGTPADLGVLLCEQLGRACGPGEGANAAAAGGSGSSGDQREEL